MSDVFFGGATGFGELDSRRTAAASVIVSRLYVQSAVKIARAPHTWRFARSRWEVDREERSRRALRRPATPLATPSDAQIRRLRRRLPTRQPAHKRVFITGGTHGNETNGVVLARHLLKSPSVARAAGRSRRRWCHEHRGDQAEFALRRGGSQPLLLADGPVRVRPVARGRAARSSSTRSSARRAARRRRPTSSSTCTTRRRRRAWRC